jgi:hypothetical protein
MGARQVTALLALLVGVDAGCQLLIGYKDAVLDTGTGGTVASGSGGSHSSNTASTSASGSGGGPACTSDAGTPCNGVEWATTFASLNASVSRIAMNPAGDVVVAGTFRTTIALGTTNLVSAGQGDLFLTKLDASGAPTWAKRFGSAADETYCRVATDAKGQILLAGPLSGSLTFGGTTLTSVGASDLFVAQLDTDGNTLWAKRFGDAKGGIVAGVAADSNGNVIIAGHMMGSIAFGGAALPNAGASDIFIAKLNSGDGSEIWSKSFGSASADYLGGLAVDGADGVLIGSWHGAPVDFGTGSTPAGVGIVKLDSSGITQWAETFQPTKPGYSVLGVAPDGMGSAYLFGTFTGTLKLGQNAALIAGAPNSDWFLAKFGFSGGSPLWSKSFGDPAIDESIYAAVKADGAGNVVLTGQLQGTVDFGTGALEQTGGGDAFVAKFDGTGSSLWARRFGDSQGQSGLDVATVAGSNDIVVGGVAMGSIDFGNGALVCPHPQPFVAELQP